MLLRIKAFIMAIYLFFAALPYGNAPVQVEFDCTIKDGVYEYLPGDWCTVYVECKNTGKPFKGETPYYPYVAFYKTENGEKIYADYDMAVVDAEGSPVIIKNGESMSFVEVLQFTDNTPKGTFHMEVKVYGCEKVYENVITIK